MRVIAMLALAVCAGAQPRRCSRPVTFVHRGSAEARPLFPGVWIFGDRLGRHCGIDNMMDPRTYKTELCGVQVLFAGIPAKLLFTSPAQINLIAPDHPWQNEVVDVQVIHDGARSTEPAFTGMPIWVRVELPWGKGWLRYPHFD